MNSKLTKTLDPDNMDFSIGEMLKEWLTRDDAFGSGASGTADITFKPDQFVQGNANVPTIFLERADNSVLTVGAGMRKTVTQDLITYRIEIRVERKESTGFLALKRKSDKLTSYFKDNDTGRSILGLSGLRRSELTGPFSAHTQKYYEHNFFLRFKTVI